MRGHSLCQCFFILSLLFALSLCTATDNTFEVVGNGECVDCNDQILKPSQAFSGLHVTIDCKLKNGAMKRFGDGELDDEGKFKVLVPQELVEDGKRLKEECYAQLHSAAAIPCPAHKGLESSKIEFKSSSKGKMTFAPIKNLQFSTALCTSKFLWPHFNYPPLPTTHPWVKHFPKAPLKEFSHSWPPLPPLPPLFHHKPLLPPVEKPPIYKPPVQPPIHKPPIKKPPVHKPPVEKPPVYKPPVEKPPVHKPPKKPSPPIKPNPPVYKPPVEKPPVYKPPVEKPPVMIPPFKKKPCPPIPKLPPFPKIPPKYFHHPKFGHFPPLPPKINHP